MSVYIHPTAEVAANATIGDKTRIWHQVHVRENVVIGTECTISKNVYLDAGVSIGNRVKIQNNVSVYHGVTIEDDVFVGPSVVFTNDVYPRSNVGQSFEVGTTLVKRGASIGANATIICGDRIIETYSTVAAGSVVTRDTSPFSLVAGNPARLIGYVCFCGRPLLKTREPVTHKTLKCNHCGKEIRL